MMLTKFFLLISIILAVGSLYAGCTQPNALVLRQERQDQHWVRNGTTASGRYTRGVWVANSNRASYGSFRGGGPGAGK
jgi:hypothetical protein